MLLALTKYLLVLNAELSRSEHSVERTPSWARRTEAACKDTQNSYRVASLINRYEQSIYFKSVANATWGFEELYSTFQAVYYRGLLSLGTWVCVPIVQDLGQIRAETLTVIPCLIEDDITTRKVPELIA